MSDTERSEWLERHWFQREEKARRTQWQRQHRAAVRDALAQQDWDGAERRWRRTSGWLTH